MELLFAKMKENGLDIETALTKLSSNSPKDEDKNVSINKNKETNNDKNKEVK